jgi:hypothetical protein
MLSVLQEKLAEAHGLAIAATTVTERVEERVDVPSLQRSLRELRRDAEETRARCLRVEESFGEHLAGELLAHAISTKEHSADLLPAWFKAGTGPLRAWVFLAMGEAGEVATWTAVSRLAAAAPDRNGVNELAEWALPVQQRHLRTALDGVDVLASWFDPDAPRWG